MSDFIVSQIDQVAVWTIDGAQRMNTLRRSMIAELIELLRNFAPGRI